MTSTPNRDKVKLSERHLTDTKQSGDQHQLPEGDRREDPHRPHRVSRDDMQKLQPADPDPDDPASP